jgi:hypothetical protein
MGSSAAACVVNTNGSWLAIAIPPAVREVRFRNIRRDRPWSVETLGLLNSFMGFGWIEFAIETTRIDLSRQTCFRTPGAYKQTLTGPLTHPALPQELQPARGATGWCPASPAPSREGNSSITRPLAPLLEDALVTPSLFSPLAADFFEEPLCCRALILRVPSVDVRKVEIPGNSAKSAGLAAIPEDRQAAGGFEDQPVSAGASASL